MTGNLRLVHGGGEAPSGGAAIEPCPPDRPLFALIEEARILESRDRMFNRQIEQMIGESEDWLNGEREEAIGSAAVRALTEAHQPVVDRLLELPVLIAETPAYSRDAILAKMRYLCSCLEGPELDILESVIEDVEYLK